MIVAFDTATATGGVAVVGQGRLYGTQVLRAEESHSENILPALDTLMERLRVEAEDVRGVAVAIGPGSFTGLRIGVAAAKALAYAWRVPIVGVSTLLAAAWAYRGLRATLVSSIDARRDHFFCAFYDPSRWNDTSHESISRSNERPLSDEDVDGEAFFGEERRWAAEAIAHHIEKLLRSGHDVLLVGEGAPALSERMYHIIRSIDRDDARSSSPDEGRRGSLVLTPLGGAFVAPHVGLIGSMYVEAGVTDDLFQLAPNYLRRSEAERRCKPSRL